MPGCQGAALVDFGRLMGNSALLSRVALVERRSANTGGSGISALRAAVLGLLAVVLLLEEPAHEGTHPLGVLLGPINEVRWHQDVRVFVASFEWPTFSFARCRYSVHD